MLGRAGDKAKEWRTLRWMNENVGKFGNVVENSKDWENWKSRGKRRDRSTKVGMLEKVVENVAMDRQRIEQFREVDNGKNLKKVVMDEIKMEEVVKSQHEEELCKSNVKCFT